jgi:stress response protein SCP2
MTPSTIFRTRSTLTSEVRMAWGIHNVDLRVLVGDGCVLGQNGDSTLTLDRVGVHDAVDNLLVCAEHTALPQQAVDQRRFAVVNVRDDGNISHIFSYHKASFPARL